MNFSMFICDLFGHKFEYAEAGAKCTVTRVCINGMKAEYEGINVDKRCMRCGYLHSDTFIILGSLKK